MKNSIPRKIDAGIFMVFALTLCLTSCIDEDGEEFVAPTGNVNNIQPSTRFTNATDADNSLSLAFRSFSTDAVSYAWDFGDNTGTSTDANPNYTFSTGGLYLVTLTTVSSDGLVAVDSTEVSPVFIDFDFTTSDTEVSFENLSTGVSAVEWSFGDGETVEWLAEDTEDDANFSPTYTYTSDDIFTATLTATNFLNEKVSISKSIEGLVLSTVPNFTFTTSDLTVTFIDNSTLAVSYSWDFGDGNSSSEVNPTHTYAMGGTYDVTLTTTNDAGVSRSLTQQIPVGGIDATFAAVLQNADFQTYPTAEMNDNDLVDAWTINPDNTFNDSSPTPFDFWRNTDLESWVSDPVNNGGSGTTDKASSSGNNAQSAGGTSSRSYKFDSSGERAYQPFEVETGVEYSISAFIRTETTPVGDVEGTFYILSDEPSADTDLPSLALATQPVISDAIDGWQQITFTFTADNTFNFSERQDRIDESIATGGILTSGDQDFVIFYFVPTTTVTGTNEVFLTDIIITTPGF